LYYFDLISDLGLLKQLFVQRDYVKWRGVLFLQFLPSLVDESEKIRHLADYLFGNILKGQKIFSIALAFICF
jgi:hypothetical protein